MAVRDTTDPHAGTPDLRPSGKEAAIGNTRGVDGVGDDVPAESAHEPGADVQPGTGAEGKSWQSREPDPHDEDDKLNQALKDSFPASDPPQPAQPGVTGWDIKEAVEPETR